MSIKDLFARNNLVIQKTSYTCGPATILNILHLKGDFSYNEEELAKLCKTDPKTGTSNKNLVAAAQKVKLKLVEEKQGATTKDIERNIDAGAFVVVCYIHAYSGEGHYAIVSEYDDRAFYFRDCSFGLFRLKKKYFRKFWHGTDGIQQWYVALSS